MDAAGSPLAFDRRRAWRAAQLASWLCAAGLVVGGCGTTNKATPLEISDDGSTAVSARSVWRIDKRRGHGIEFDFAQQRGKDTSALASGERLQFGTAVITGPESLRNEATVRTYHVAYNYLIPSSEPVEAEFFAGFGRIHLKLQAQGSTPGAQISHTDSGGALVVGVGPRWKLNPQLALEGRLTMAEGLFFTPTEQNRIDVALAYRPANQVTLRAGYTWVKVVVERDSPDSNVSVRLRGPLLGLTLNF